MCLLSYYGPDVMPWEDRLAEGVKNNPHGSGFALITDERKLVTGKAMDGNKVLERFLALRDRNRKYPALFHSRIATGGNHNVDNCHPFTLGNDRRTVIAHNGVLFSVNPKMDGGMSDTAVFAARIMPQVYGKLDRPHVQRKLNERLGKFNKLVVLTVNKRYDRWAYIFGERNGDWDVGPQGQWGDDDFEGAWHSNSSWRKRNYSRFHPTWDRSGSKFYENYADCEWCGSVKTVNPAGDGHCDRCRMCSKCDEWGKYCVCPPGWVSRSQYEYTRDPKTNVWHRADYVRDPKTGIWRQATLEEARAAEAGDKAEVRARLASEGWVEDAKGHWRRIPKQLTRGAAMITQGSNGIAEGSEHGQQDPAGDADSAAEPGSAADSPVPAPAA